MAMARFAHWLLTRASTAGAREALVGDLMEEIAHGRSSWWIVQELVGLYGFGFVAQARDSVRITPLVVGPQATGSGMILPLGNLESFSQTSPTP